MVSYYSSEYQVAFYVLNPPKELPPMATRIPPPVPNRFPSRASLPRYSVVTSTSKGLKSSATALHAAMMLDSSVLLKAGSESVL
jgi:hypothetical protein